MKFPKFKIGDICTIVHGHYPTMKTPPGPYPLVVTADFRRSADSYQLEGPAVCVPLISSTGHGDAALHRVHYQEGKFALANLLVALLPKDPNLFDAKYLYHLLMVRKDEYFVPLMLGTANVSLKEKDIADVEIPLPPLSEQRRIVAKIEELAAKIEDARSLRQQAIEKAEALLRASVSEIDCHLRESYPLTTLQELASKVKGSLRSGPFGSALLHSEFVPDGVPAIGIQDVQENLFVLTRRWNVTPEKADELKRYTIKPLDIIVTVMGTLGRACVVPDDVPRMISTKHVWTITLDQTKAEPRWVSYWLNFARTVREELLGQGTGTAIAGLNGEKIRKLSLPAIPISEQRRIVRDLEAFQAKMDGVKRLQAETAIELDALLPSILDKAFKGEL